MHNITTNYKSDRIIAAQDIPATNFTCADKTPGYYADVETGCQVYHMCAEGGQHFSYKCPNTTLFQQRMLICAHWYQVNCSRSEQDYTANLLIGQRDKPFVDDSEHISIYYHNENDFHPFRNPEDLQRLGTNGNGGGRVPNAKFMPNKAPSLTQPHQPTPTELTSRFFDSTNPPSTHFVPFPTTNNPAPNLQPLHTRPSPSTPVHQFTPFTTHLTTTPVPRTETFQPDYDTSTTDYYDETINNSYNSFINRFVPYLNETNTTVTDITATVTEDTTVTETVSTLSLSSRNAEPITHFRHPSPTKPSITEAIFITDRVHSHQDNSKNNANANEQNSNIYNNFITRFVPDVNDTDEIKHEEVAVVHKFLKRFNPDEVVPHSNFNNNPTTFHQQNIESLAAHSPFFINENLVSSHSLMPPVQEPSVNLELPKYTDDAVHMESSLLELRFPDPRHAFFIPDNDKENVAIENETPITVSIPRHHSNHQLHPMLFVNSVSDCSKCHPSFIVDTINCTPCVVIR